MLNEPTERRNTLFTDETFEKLRDAQRIIQEATDLSPSLRLLINDVINDESINKSIERLTEKLSKQLNFS